MDLIETEALVCHLKAQRDELTAQRDAAIAKIAELPRKDKAGAQALTCEIVGLNKQLKILRIEIIKAEEVLHRRNQHSLWEHAVIKLYGHDGLRVCRTEMQQERKNREAKEKAT